MREWIKDIAIAVGVQLIFILIATFIIHFAPKFNDTVWFMSGLLSATIYLPIINRKDYEKEV